MLKRRIPLAWKQLTKERGRMFVAIAGIAFADVLMRRNRDYDGTFWIRENNASELNWMFTIDPIRQSQYLRTRTLKRK